MSAFTQNSLYAFVSRETERPDFGRAIRATLALMVPILAGGAGWLPLNISFMAFAAQSVAIVDIRGAYTVRLGLLLAMTAILTGAAQLGESASSNIVSAVLAAGIVALFGGVWRHIIPDYGTSLAISSTLLFLISVSYPPASGTAGHVALASFAGGLWGILLQVAYWPFRPQYPLRRAVSDSWAAVADLFEALGPGEHIARSERIHQREAVLRTTLDQAYAALAVQGRARTNRLRARLDELNLAAARLATRVVALNTVLEAILASPDAAGFSEALQPLLRSLTNTSRSIAVILVSRQPAHLASGEVRLQRLENLLEVFESQTAPRLGDPGAAAQLDEILHQMSRNLATIREALRATVDPADERAAFSLELFDLQTWTLRPLASALVLHHPVDRTLLRFTARVSVLTMLGVAAFKSVSLPHGYWLPLTMIIILQPDYGTTRQKAGQRSFGTFFGSLAASLLLWLRLPAGLLAAATAGTTFCFGYFLKRNYAIAVFFVTLMVVLLTEARSPVTWQFTAERVGCTIAGVTVALFAAFFFWPVWERERVPRILAAALDANRDYLRLIVQRFDDGGAYDAAAVALKRKAESANSAVFASLQRMRADPASRQTRLAQMAALANGNQRITRACNVLALQLAPGFSIRSIGLGKFLVHADKTLSVIAAVLRGESPAASLAADSALLRETIENAGWTGATPLTEREHGVVIQIPRIATELRAMVVAAEHASASTTEIPAIPAAS